MRGIRLYAILAAMFIAGAFLASPELRAYAANTVGSADIINNSILSADIKDGEVKTVDLGGNAVTSAKIKDGEVKTADIGLGAVAAGRIADGAVGTLKIADDSIMAVDIQADSVGASELQGVSKLIFAECFKTEGVIPVGGFVEAACLVPGAAVNDNVIASTPNTGSSGNTCFGQTRAIVNSINNVLVNMTNHCGFPATFGTFVRISIIVYDIQ